VAIDADANEIIIDPDQETIDRARRRIEDHRPAQDEDAERRHPSATADGVRIRLEANVEFPDDLAAARYAGAEGIGLYRSEFLLTPGLDGGAGVPDEESQYLVYRRMLEEMQGEPVTIRTFDVDEDQLLGRVSGDDDWHPGRQGRRGLRLGLAREDLFRTQLRALLRAAQHGSLRILFPFVSGVDEVRAARRVLAEAAEELALAGVAGARIPIGVMIEVPAAAYTADLLAREADFLTIGTNDLIQYCLAVDRADERVSRLYEPLHPAILRVIVMVQRAASRRKIPVSLCGEMASDPTLLPLLVGLGLRDFSMTPAAIPVAKRVLKDAQSGQLRALARRVLALSTADEVERELVDVLSRLNVEP
jgi:phosphotransferase system enzyme I (PtsI)